MNVNQFQHLFFHMHNFVLVTELQIVRILILFVQ